MTLAVERKVHAVMGAVGRAVKRSMKDPDMPSVAARAVDKTVDSVWDDVTEEVVGVVLSKLRRRVPVVHSPPATCCPNPLRKARAVFLYARQPYDKTIWAQVKDPLFWVLTAVSLFPLFGVPQAFYLLCFLLIDKRDEFQVCQFILGFKGVQFITVGILRRAAGASLSSSLLLLLLLLLVCVTSDECIQCSGW